MRRRQFLGVLSGVVTWPLTLRAQQAGRVHRIGFLWENPNTFPDALEAFRQELRRLGYMEGAISASSSVGPRETPGECATSRKSSCGSKSMSS
jgi:hypothetical protein